MRNNVTIFTATKDNEVLLVDTNLKSFVTRLGQAAPHYNTLYKNFEKAAKYIYGNLCLQKHSADQNDGIVMSAASPAL